MQIKLPDINIQPDWTIAGQIKKIGEEFSEVAEAAVLGNSTTLLKETLDVMQTCCTLIKMVAEDIIDLDVLLREHEAKLIAKGYMDEFAPSKYTDSPY